MSFKKELDRAIAWLKGKIDDVQQAIWNADEDTGCECECNECTGAHGELSLRGDPAKAEKELKRLRAELARLERYRETNYKEVKT